MADIRSGTQRDISNTTYLILKTIDSVFVCEKSWYLSLPTKFIVVTTKIV